MRAPRLPDPGSRFGMWRAVPRGAAFAFFAGLLGWTGAFAAEPTRVVPQSADQVRLSFAPVVAQVAPAVVNIHARQQVERRPGGVPPLFQHPFFQNFFGQELGLPPLPGPGQSSPENSLGSGVIVSEDGLIVTNHHVIDGASEITVSLADGREFAAEQVRSDPRTDLAILRISAGDEHLPTIPLMADSDALQVGDLVLAIGNPFGVGQTVTSGIVSALARTTAGIADYSFFIQTDAAINPGNSGGALVTLDGRLAGINTAIFSTGISASNVGIGFAIPADMVRTVIETESGDRVIRPWTGAVGQDVTSDLAEGLGLDRPVGVLIRRLFRDGPLARAGARPGDVVTNVGGRMVRDRQALRYHVATSGIGGSVSVGIVREGKSLTLTMPLEAPPEVPARDPQEIGGKTPLAGSLVDNLSPALADELGLDLTLEGIVVIDIRRGSPAHRAGFELLDILHRLNGDKLTRMEHLQEALERHAVGDWEMHLRRGNQVRRVWLDR